MPQFGKNIAKFGDQLHNIEMHQLIHAIKHPKEKIVSQIDQLRQLRSVDKKAYSNAKKCLPYFVCAHFSPNFRKNENFNYTNYFIIDIDKIASSNHNIDVLKEKLGQSKQIHALFTSPSGDGLKVIFKLSKPCTDANLYKVFYKKFARKIAQDFGMEDILDSSTSDVARACFISIDEHLYYNENSNLIVIENYINIDDAESELFDLQSIEKNKPKPFKEKIVPTDDAFAAIKNRLNPKAPKLIKTPNYYIPTEIEDILPIIGEKLPKYELVLRKKKPISYGQTLIIAYRNKWAEINLFYGKKGYTIIKTTKTGSNSELATVVKEVLQEIIANYENEDNNLNEWQNLKK